MKKLRVYRFRHAGLITSHSLANAIRQITHAKVGDLPELKESTAGHFDIHFGLRGYRDTFLGIEGDANYPKPQPYKPPADDYTGDDDWLWGTIMSHRGM